MLPVIIVGCYLIIIVRTSQECLIFFVSFLIKNIGREKIQRKVLIFPEKTLTRIGNYVTFIQRDWKKGLFFMHKNEMISARSK